MRLAIGVLCFLSFGLIAAAQCPKDVSGDSVHVRRLTIVSNDLPNAERDQIALTYQGGNCNPEELAERIRQNLRDLGYAEATVGAPRLSAIRETPAPRSADFTFQISAGAKYRLSEIRFENASVFPPGQLRRQFPIEDGALFNATAIGKGLDNLKTLYVSEAYINLGAIPKTQIDEARHTISLVIDVDQGKRFFFGRLFFDGVEPHAGAAQALLAEWKELEGKVYSPEALAQWVSANATFMPIAERTPEKCVTAHQNPDVGRIDIVLEFPDTAPQSP